MIRSLFSLVILSAPLAAAEAPRFRFAVGETLQYHVEQKTDVTETVMDEKAGKLVTRKTTTALDLVRQWKVTDTNIKGMTTLEMSIVRMRWEQKAGDGAPDVFDSTKPDDLNKGVMAKNVGPVLAVLIVMPTGSVAAVKESKVGPAHRFQADIPFKLAFSPDDTKETWSRDYVIQLDPPHGTGEKYAAKQTYKPIEPKNGFLIYGLTTDIAEMPKGAEQVPLLPLMPAGSLYFHPETGRYYGARLKIEKDLTNHAGEGTAYKYVSSYTEDLVPEKK